MSANKMDVLLDKIERRLGTRPLNLPDYLRKDKWAETVIENETLDTYSRLFPNKLRVTLDMSKKRKDGFFVIDDDICDSVEIIGVRDIDWDLFGRDTLRLHDALGYGTYNFLANNIGVEDVALLQMRADQTSLFNNQIFIDYKPPNMVKLSTVTGADVTRGIKEFPIVLFIKHASNLMTISPTMMEIFEELAIADVASYLFNELKYYDGLENVYVNIDMKMSDLESKASKRDDIVQRLDEAHVSTANENQPYMLTV